MVMISPARATTNPAPAEGYTSRIVIRKPVGRPSLDGSSENEYYVFAIQMGVCAKPMASHWAIFFSATAV